MESWKDFPGNPGKCPGNSRKPWKTASCWKPRIAETIDFKGLESGK